MISEGLKIGDYIIEDELGSGGFGRVYLAQDESTGQKIAIKFLHSKKLQSKETKDAFIGEMINQARLSTNPNIVQVIRNIRYDDNQGEHMGLVMEYVEGEPLDLFIQKYGLLPEYIAIPIFLQVLNGLAFAHRHKMIHRDIKPGNIMIGNDGIVKIMDFGLSKIITGSTSASESARAASLNYVSPERLEKKNIDQRTDIYSLGATFYESLTGNPPHEIEDDDWQAAILKHKSGKFKHIQKFYPQHSELVERVVRKMLSPKPVSRYSCCEEIIKDLKTALNNSEIPETLREEFLTIIEKTDKITSEQIDHLVPPPSGSERSNPQELIEDETDIPKMSVKVTDVKETIDKKWVSKSENELKKKWLYMILAIVAALVIVVVILVSPLTQKQKNKEKIQTEKNEIPDNEIIGSEEKNYYSIQVGAFGILSNAENYSEKFINLGYNTKIIRAIVNNRVFFRLWVGQFKTIEDANKEKIKLEEMEGKKFIIVKPDSN